MSLPLHQHVQSFLTNPVHSDVHVTCCGVEHKLHRIVLLQSPYFEGALSDAWAPASHPAPPKDLDAEGDSDAELGSPHRRSTASEAPGGIARLHVDLVTAFEETADALVEAFSLCVQAMYAFPVAVSINQANIRAVMQVASFLGLNNVLNACARFAFEDLASHDTVAFYANLVHNLEWGPAGKTIAEGCMAYLLRNAPDMTGSQLADVPLDMLLDVLRSAFLWAPSELDHALLLARVFNTFEAMGATDGEDGGVRGVFRELAAAALRLEYLPFHQLQTLLAASSLVTEDDVKEALWRGMTLKTDSTTGARGFRFGVTLKSLMDAGSHPVTEVSAPVHWAGSVFTVEGRRYTRPGGGECLAVYLRRTVCTPGRFGGGCQHCGTVLNTHDELSVLFSVRLCGAPGAAMPHSVVGRSRHPKAFSQGIERDRWGWEQFLCFTDVQALPGGSRDLRFLVTINAE